MVSDNDKACAAASGVMGRRSNQAADSNSLR